MLKYQLHGALNFSERCLVEKKSDYMSYVFKSDVVSLYGKAFHSMLDEITN